MYKSFLTSANFRKALGFSRTVTVRLKADTTYEIVIVHLRADTAYEIIEPTRT